MFWEQWVLCTWIERINIKIHTLKPFKSGKEKDVYSLNKHNVALSKYYEPYPKKKENLFVLNYFSSLF